MNIILKLAVIAGFLLPSWFVLIPPKEETTANTEAQTLGAAWRSDDVGKTVKGGRLMPTQDGVMLKGSGSGIRENHDGFHFVSQPWTGDGEFIVRISDVQSPGGQGVAGLMVRGGLEPNAAFVLTGFMAKGKAIMQKRSQSGSNAESRVFGAVSQARQTQAPIRSDSTATAKSRVLSGVTKVEPQSWFKIERRGMLFSGFQSTDGVNWSWLGTEALNVGATVYVGLAATSSEESNELSANFAGVQVGPLTTPGPAAPHIGTGDGLLGTYEGKSTGGRLQRIDPTIDFQWGLGGPSQEVGKDLFAVRWEGMLEPQFSELYTLQAIGRDGMRLWVDGRLLIDLWNEQGGDPTAEIALTAGKKVHIRLEYFANYGKANMQLFWSGPSTARQVIPQSQLYSKVEEDALADFDGDGIPDKWEIANGLDPKNPQDALLDYTGDGTSNLQKYLSGRDITRGSAIVKEISGSWQAQDIGDVAYPGTFEQRGYRIRIGASGDNIQYWKDGFQFVYQRMQGDVQIVARVDSVSKVDPWAKAGVMIRADLTDRAANAFLALTPDNGPTAQERTRYSAFTDWRGWPDRTQYRWIKLIRRGNGVSSFASRDGIVWEWLHHREVALGATVYVGLAVCSANNAKFTEAEFTHVQAGPAEPLKEPDAAASLGDGLLGRYSDTRGAVAQQVDPQVAFDWGLGAPIKGLDSDNFDVTWEGVLEAPRTETYQLILQVKDRARLWVDGQMLIDLTASDIPEEALPRYQGKPITLRAGHRYAIKVEYHAHENRALVLLQWKSASIAEQPIPQRYLYSPQNKLFASSPDSDGDGMPDAWEIAYGLDPNNAKDAQDDSDGDGLTNLQEFQAGSDPRKVDSNEDGIPDAWAAKYGLEAGGEPIANQDADHDGLSNVEEFRHGTDPTKADTDGDGLTDLEELVETGTDVSASDIESMQTVAQAPGKSAVGKLGEWEVDKDVIYAKSQRGYVEYDLEISQADMFRLEVAGGVHRAEGNFTFPLILSIDGEYLDRRILYGTNSVNTLTPWLTAGAHRVRVYWDNASKLHPPLEISAVRLISLKGKDKDGNGVSDWVDNRLKAFNTIDAGDAKVISSLVSPFSLEGRVRYPGTMKLQSSSKEVEVHAGAGARWYANVPLVLYGSAQVEASFQNGGLNQSAAIRWEPLDIAKTNTIAIRKGDSLWLTVEGVGNADVVDLFDLTVSALTNFTGKDKPVVVQFDQPGTYLVQASRKSNGAVHTLNVTVVDWNPGGEPLAWLGKSRDWAIPKVPDGVLIESGPGISLENLGNSSATKTDFSLEVNQSGQHVLARLREQGPILANVEAKEFALYSGSETSVQVVKTNEDGSKFVDMDIVMSPVRPEATINIVVLIGGITFEDGTVEKNLTAADFNELGVATVRFVKSAQHVGSLCHQLRIYQNGVLVGHH